MFYVVFFFAQSAPTWGPVKEQRALIDGFACALLTLACVLVETFQYELGPNSQYRTAQVVYMIVVGSSTPVT